MNERLSQDQIADLVEAAKAGQLPDEPQAPVKRRQRTMRTVDFSRPTKFNSDHQRRIARTIDAFCHTAATRLSAELRTPVEMEAINTMQLTWQASQQQMPASAVAMNVELHPLGTRMLLVAETTMMLQAIEHLLGGMTDGQIALRRLSEIDWALTRRMLESFVHQLSPLWEDIGGVQLVPGDVDMRAESSPIAGPSDPALAVLVEVRINRQSGMLALLLPWAAIEEVGDRISGKELDEETRDPFEAAAVAQAMSGAAVTLRAEVAATELSVDQVLALVPGDLIRLGQRAEDGALLFIEETPLRRAAPGRSGRRRAVRVLGESHV